MSTRSSQLLALIHQHLLQNGYCKAARELQIESGEKFISQKVSLKQIFRHWNTKGPKTSDASSKKPRSQDPVSSSESSDEEDNAHPKEADLVVQGKKDSVKKASKLKTKSSATKKMNSAKKSASKGKGTTKTGAASLNLKPVAAETPGTLAKSSEDSDSEDETVPSKATPVLETPLKSTPAEVLKSKTSLTTDSQASRHDKSLPAKMTTTKPLSSSNGKAVAKDDSSETSESSDETDIEKPPVNVTPNITTPSVSKLKTKTPSTGTQPKADSSESSESESEDEPGSQIPTPATFQMKAITLSAKTSAAQVKATKKNAITKAPPVAPASQSGSAVGKPPAKTMVDDSSEDSDSDEELVPSTPIPTAPNSVQASKQKLQMQPTVPKPSPDDSSSSETESEEEPVRQKVPLPEVAASQDKIDPPLTVSQSKPARSDCNDASADTVVAVVSENSASLGKTQSPAKAEVSETSDSSDSEKEPELQNQKTTASPKKGVTPATQAKVSIAQASKPSTVIPAAAEGSESSDSSDSDSESEAPKKAANNLPELNVRTPVSSTKRPVATSRLAKARTPLPAPADDTSETEDSNSDEEPAAKKTESQLQPLNLKTPSLSASTGKTRTQLQRAALATDSSETEDSDSDEKPEAKKTASQLSASSLKTPSTSAKQPVTPSHTANAVAGKSGNLQKTIADDSSETEDSDSEEDEGAKKTGSNLPASSGKTQSTGGKQPNTLAAHTTGVKVESTPLPADDSSEDSSSDESLAKAPTPAIATPKQKPIAKSTAVTPSSQASAAAVRTPAKTAADESSEDSDSDEEPSFSIKAPDPTIVSPSVRPSEAITARVPDSDADSESSDSEEKTPAVGTAKPSKPALAAKGKPGISATSQPDEESSSEDSDSDTKEHVQSAIQTQKTKVASRNKTAATPSAAPLSATKEKTPASRKARVAQNPLTDTSETIDSSDYDNPLPSQPLKGSFVSQKGTVKLSLQPGTAVKSKKGSPVKAVTDTVKENSGSIKEEQDILKTDVHSLAKRKKSTAIPLLTSTPSVASPAKGKAGLTMSQKAVMTSQALVKESGESESDGKVTEQVGTPAPTSAKAVVEKRNRSVAKTPKASKEKTVKSASRGKTAKVSSESSESISSDEKATEATKQTPTVQTKLERFFFKQSITPAKTKAKTTASLPKAFLTSDDEEKPVKEETPAPDTPKASHGKLKERLDSSSFATPKTKAKMACLISSPKATDTDSKVSGDVPSKPTASEEEDDSADYSEPEESQSRLQAKTPSKPLSAKRKRDKKDKTALSSKRKPKVKTQPSTESTLSAPATPGALLDSEEETVMALLEGRSPKKSKKNPSKKTVAATQVVASSTPTVQDSNVLEKSLPPPVLSALVPESPNSVPKGDKTLDAKSPGVPELGHLSAKKEKHGKKRKSSSEDGLSKQKAKKAKKEKKDKKVKDTSITGEAANTKPSKKEKKKSEKSKKKKDKKQKKKESKKLSQSLIAPVRESDSGVSLQSKPKKKKKVKGD